MKIPRATYRLQFNGNFTFKKAIELVEYFKELGISHCYCSPLFKAKVGSTHGYDLVDPTQFNPEIGTKEEFIAFAKKLQNADIGLIVDIVSNHMYIGNKENSWWQQVLERGPSSPYAKYFDITWTDGKVILPSNEELPEQEFYRFTDPHSPELNYRRFFDISDYAGIRVEEEEVYREMHRLVFSLGKYIDGLRVDHIDGLYNPLEYLQKLRKDFPKYIIVEKILLSEETLPKEWPVQGTVGYEFLNQANALFVYRQNKLPFWSLYHEFTEVEADVEKLYYICKKFILESSLQSEIERLHKLLPEASKEELIAVIAYFPVYRTYINSDAISAQDRQAIDNALNKAKRVCNPSTIAKQFPNNLDFVMHFQQVTGPAMAKGIEDTAFYRFYPLASLDEVGNDLNSFGKEIEDLQRHREHSMLATSTHDTKRSEDVRARLNVLSEMPDRWKETIWRWHNMNQPTIDRNEEYLLYQTLVGSWPIHFDDSYTERIVSYMSKALNEAKINSSWAQPNEAYLQLMEQTIEKMLSHQPFVQDLASFVASIRNFGYFNSLAETLIKLTFPGVPDIYQGCELWNFSLVDPDNRRPVDFEIRKKLINKSLDACLATLDDGSIKQFLIKTVLQCRNLHSDLFTFGSYSPRKAKGPLENHVLSFTRSHNGKSAITVTGRFFSRIAHSWEDTYIDLPSGMSFQDIFTKKVFRSHVSLADLFEKMPFALLISQ